jgi:hypothetical protein
LVDRLSRPARDSWPPDAMRLYRENLALKVQLDALAAEVSRVRGKKARVSLGTRAAQVWACLVTRGNPPFQKHNLSSSVRTILKKVPRTHRYLQVTIAETVDGELAAIGSAQKRQVGRRPGAKAAHATVPQGWLGRRVCVAAGRGARSMRRRSSTAGANISGVSSSSFRIAGS